MNNIREKNINNNENVLSIRHMLENIAEDKYKEFSASLLPGIDNILGVRIPKIREIAKKTSEKDSLEYLSYFEHNTELYFEEIMLQGFLISNIKDSNISFSWVKKFVKKINNWSVCDSFCSSLKIVQKNKEQYFELIKQCIVTNETYYQRFAIVLLLNYYITDEYIDQVLGILEGVRSEQYYVKMAIAWAISICYIKYSEKTTRVLENNTLDDFTHNKTIQKIRESYRVDSDIKEKLKELKR